MKVKAVSLDAAKRLYDCFKVLDPDSLHVMRRVLAMGAAAIITSEDWLKGNENWREKAKTTVAMLMSLLVSVKGTDELHKVEKMGVEAYLVELILGDQILEMTSSVIGQA